MTKEKIKKGSKTMMAKLKYEDSTGRVRGTSLAPPTQRFKNSSRRRIVKALEAALNEFMMPDEEPK
jgi:hypothetical protein